MQSITDPDKLSRYDDQMTVSVSLLLVLPYSHLPALGTRVTPQRGSYALETQGATKYRVIRESLSWNCLRTVEFSLASRNDMGNS